MKTIRFNRHGIKVFGYETWFATYGKNSKGKYQIDVLALLGFYDKIAIYKSFKKPKIRNLYLLTALLLPLCPIAIAAMTIFLLPYTYSVGFVNFVKDSSWQEHVRFFNWVNIFVIIILILILLFK